MKFWKIILATWEKGDLVQSRGKNGSEETNFGLWQQVCMRNDGGLDYGSYNGNRKKEVDQILRPGKDLDTYIK